MKKSLLHAFTWAFLFTTLLLLTSNLILWVEGRCAAFIHGILVSLMAVSQPLSALRRMSPRRVMAVLLSLFVGFGSAYLVVPAIIDPATHDKYGVSLVFWALGMIAGYAIWFAGLAATDILRVQYRKRRRHAT